MISLEQFGNEVDWDKSFGLCGMGGSKSEKIFPPDTTVITINKAHLSYKEKPNYICTVFDHRDEILPLVPADVPFVVIEKTDFLKYGLCWGGPISSMMYFISKRIKDNHTIYLIGNEMSDSRDWTPYVKAFYEVWLDCLQYRKTVKVEMLDGNTNLDFFR